MRAAFHIGWLIRFFAADIRCRRLWVIREIALNRLGQPRNRANQPGHFPNTSGYRRPIFSRPVHRWFFGSLLSSANYHDLTCSWLVMVWLILGRSVLAYPDQPD